jgi:hypothetical protein
MTRSSTLLPRIAHAVAALSIATASLAACNNSRGTPTATDAAADSGRDSGTDVQTDTEPDVTRDTTPDGTTVHWRESLPTPPEFDCSTVPNVGEVIDQELLPGARGYHGLAFNSGNQLVGNDRASLIRASRAGVWEVWLPGIGSVEQIAFLPNGQLIAAAADRTGLYRIEPDGTRVVISPDIQAYGVEYAPDGMIYAAGGEGVWRVNPTNGQTTTLLRGTGDFLPHSITFNNDYSLMVIGVITGLYGEAEADADGGTGGDGARPEPQPVPIFGECQGAPNGQACNNPNTGEAGECLVVRGVTECWPIDFGEGGDLPATPAQVNACASSDDGAACFFGNERSGDTAGLCYTFQGSQQAECWYFGFPDRSGFGASSAQRRICDGQEPFDDCLYTNRWGESAEGECYDEGVEGGLECWDFGNAFWPDLEAADACEGRANRSACEFVSAASGRVNGNCVSFEAEDAWCYAEDFVEPVEGASDIVAFEVDLDLTPIGDRLTYAEDVGGGYHDAVSFDICGNLYVSDFVESALFRIAPNRTVERIIQWDLSDDPLTSYGHGLLWGNGTDDWSPTSAIVPLPYANEQVKVLQLGVPSSRWDGSGL